ncbi:MAG: WD40 repeat domain-containing protein, partial [Planctomycetota bacterium]
DYLLDARTLAVIRPIRGHQGTVQAAAWTASGSRLITASQDGRLQTWDRTTGRTSGSAVGATAQRTLALTPDDRGIIVADSALRVFPLEDPSVLRGHESYVYRVEISPDGRLLASAGLAERNVHVWNVAVRALQQLPAPEQNLSYASAPHVVFALDSRRLVAYHSDKVNHWDLATFEPLPVVRDGDNPVHDTLGWRPVLDWMTAAMSPDGKVLALTGKGSVDLYDIAACHPGDANTLPGPREGAQPLGRLLGHDGIVHCVAFAPGGTRLATGGADGTVRIWDARTYEQLLVLNGHEDYVMDVDFSPDGTLLASASGDKTVRLWDTVPLHERRAMAGE